jgi:hypothetical protein
MVVVDLGIQVNSTLSVTAVDVVQVFVSDVKNLDANGSVSHPIHLHPPNDS